MLIFSFLINEETEGFEVKEFSRTSHPSSKTAS